MLINVTERSFVPFCVANVPILLPTNETYERLTNEKKSISRIPKILAIFTCVSYRRTNIGIYAYKPLALRVTWELLRGLKTSLFVFCHMTLLAALQ